MCASRSSARSAPTPTCAPEVGGKNEEGEENEEDEEDEGGGKDEEGSEEKKERSEGDEKGGDEGPSLSLFTPSLTFSAFKTTLTLSSPSSSLLVLRWAQPTFEQLEEE